jgi:hypothetical protein
MRVKVFDRQGLPRSFTTSGTRPLISGSTGSPSFFRAGWVC